MNLKPRKILTSKPFLIVIGLLLAYFLFAYFAVDPIARRVLPWVAENKLASRMTVERVAFDPLRLSLTVDGLRLTQPNGAPLAGFERLFVDLESSGLFKFAWRLRDIHLVAPQVVMDVAPDGRFNWHDLIAKLNEDQTPEEDSEPARLIIDHILIERGNVEYTERNRQEPFKTVLQPLGLELEGLSTLPESRGDYLLAAKLPEQGGTVKWKGDLALNPLASKGAIDIQQINLAKLMQLVNPQALPFRLDGSRLSSSFSYDFSLTQDTPEPVPQAHLSNIAIQLTDTAAELDSGAKIALAEAGVQLPALDFSMIDGAQVRFQGLGFTARQLALTQDDRTLFNLPAADVTGVDFDSTQNQLNIAEIVLQDGAINAMRAQDGSIDWQQLIATDAPTANDTETGDAKAADTTPADAASMESSDTETAAAATAAPADAVPAKTAGAKQQQPFAFAIGSIRLQNWQAAYADHSFVHPLHATIAGINLGGAVNNAGGTVTLRDFGLELGQTTLQSALYRQPLASLSKASLQGGQVNLEDSSVSIAAIRFSGLQTQVLREAGKPLNWQVALAQVPSAAQPAPAPQPASPSPWKLALNEMTLEDSSVHFADKSTPTPVVLDVQNARLDLRNGTLDLSRPLPVNASLQLKQGGRLDASGKIAFTPFKSDLQIKMSALALRPFSPYINQAAMLKLDKGQASLNGKLSLASKKEFTGKFSGGFSIDNLAINEEASDVLFLGWRSVASNSVKLDIAPNRLRLDELRIAEPVGKFIIYEDRTLNVSRILRQPPSAQTGSAPPVPPADAKNGNGEPGFPVAVERISISGGDLEFADLSLTPQFGTHINTLSGVINGLSTNPAAIAQVELDGKVDEYGSARIRGTVQPFQATEHTDLKLVFRNLEMNRLTPYSGKFAGRKIDSGKLSVDLEYKIEDRKLAGENKFVITRLELGERVESPDAVSLPLDLAIALLQDSNGVIDLDLPISGSLDDPQFSYGKIVWKAVLNVIGKVVTSPFRALGNLLGMSSDKLEAVNFEPGKSALAPEEQEQLKAVGEAMSKRASLTLAIVPTFDPAADKAALQEQATRRDVARELGLQLEVDEIPGPVDLNNVKVQTAVENLLKDRRGEKRDLAMLDSLKDYFSKPKPEDLPKYTAMLEQLEATVKVTDAELLALANARAVALRDYLVQKAALSPERVTLAEPVKMDGDGKNVRLKLELGVASGTQPQ